MRKFFVAALCLMAARPIAAHERANAPRPQAHKKDAGFVAQPIKPMEKNNEKPRAGWNGFYGGLNAGGGFSDTESR
jgi:opacity protein-like surface antigen